jgi:hypothetical protein
MPVEVRQDALAEIPPMVSGAEVLAPAIFKPDFDIFNNRAGNCISICVSDFGLIHATLCHLRPQS